MESSNQEAFFQVMETLNALYEKEPNIILAKMVFKVMAPYSLEEFTAAVERHIADPKFGMFYPKPADLIRAIQVDTSKVALKAWQGVIRRLERLGDSQPFKSDDKAVFGAVEAIGGWSRLCTLTYTQINELERQFLDSYSELKEPAPQLTSEAKKLEY